MNELPEGTVTVLFTDTVGSTALNQRLGDEASNALRQAIVALTREQVEKHRGVEVKRDRRRPDVGLPVGTTCGAL